jgi:hypothetical protein
MIVAQAFAQPGRVFFIADLTVLASTAHPPIRGMGANMVY